ncbi:MAG: hypothetical protein JSV24_00495 [Bacteroidales bacterium]|nr:MAG: hypothetical protein JSV24_00495 [Bacteroidales bacterium]
MAATLSKYYFAQERLKMADEYVDRIIELKKSRDPDALSKILSLKRIIRAMYNVNY